MDLVTRCRRGLLAASIVAGVVSGCTDAAGPNDYNAALAPGAGSIYAVDVYPTDSFGNKKSSTGLQDTIHPTPVVAVAGVPSTFPDVSNVISFDVPQIVSLSNTGLLDRYFRYLSNGNVAVFRQKGTLSMPGATIPLDSMWIELPFGTKSKYTWTEVDTNWIASGNKTNNLTVTWTVAFDKVETLLGAVAPTPLAVFRPDPALTANAGLAAVTGLCDQLGVIGALDAAVGPVRQRDRGFGAGELLTGIAAAQLAGEDFLTGLDRQRADAAGQQVTPVPGLASTTAAGLARRVTPAQWRAVESGLAAVTGRMLDLLPAPRAAALAEGPVTIDLDTTDVEVYGRKKRGVAYNHQGQRVGRPHVAAWAETEIVLAADLGDGTDDPRATAPDLLRRALAALPPRARASGRQRTSTPALRTLFFLVWQAQPWGWVSQPRASAPAWAEPSWLQLAWSSILLPTSLP